MSEEEEAQLRNDCGVYQYQNNNIASAKMNFFMNYSVILLVKCAETVTGVDSEQMRDLTLQHAMIALKDTFSRTRVKHRVCHACLASLAM